jgi:transposase InsO family protein
VREGRFSEEQMVAVLREADRTSVAETVKKHNVSEQTIYAWRKHFGVKWFRSLAEAEVVIEAWRLHFNAIRPHSSLNYLTPLEFKRQHHPSPNAAEATSSWMFFGG